MQALKYTGFQATHLGQAIEEVNRMIRWRLSDEPRDQNDEGVSDEERAKTKCTIFLSFTSNMISCGAREVIRFLVQHRMVDCVVTTAGGIEEDFMKCIKPHYLGSFSLPGKSLRRKGFNRIGNLIVPNLSYTDFEEWISPILQTMHDEQDASTEAWRKDPSKEQLVWTPSKMIHRLGKEMNNPESVWYWCYKNDIPVFCPAITDGSVGDMLFFHQYKRPGFNLDIARDIFQLNHMAMTARKSGMIILGGGLVKHHTCNANLMRNGADYSVFVNTGQEFDGSDSGARPDEAISWGKIRLDARPVKVYADASLILPLLVSQTFAIHGERIEACTAELRKWKMEGKAVGGGEPDRDPEVARAMATGSVAPVLQPPLLSSAGAASGGAGGASASGAGEGSSSSGAADVEGDAADAAAREEAQATGGKMVVRELPADEEDAEAKGPDRSAGPAVAARLAKQLATAGAGGDGDR